MELFSLIIGALLLALAYSVYRQRLMYQAQQQSLTSQNKHCDQLQKDLANQQVINEKSQADLTQAEAVIFKLRQQVAQFDDVKASLERQLIEKEMSMANLQMEIAASAQDSHQSKALFSTIANVAFDLVFVLDQNETIIALNKSAQDLFGAKNPIGEHFAKVVNAPDLEDIVQRALNEDESLEEQFRIDKNYYRARTQVLRYGNGQAFIGVAMQDVSQLVRLNRARRDMVANISHELSTPIANIRLIIEGLFHEQHRPKRKDSISSLRAIAREADNLQWTVQELLDLSMIESGQAIMKLVEEVLAPIAEEAIERLEEKLLQKHLTVAPYIPAKIRVLCEPDHIRRVFINLLSNAIKWSPTGAVITMSAIRQGDEVTISVFDKGVGVPDEQCERIFERFYQVDTSRSGHEGSGLGLAICKHIVEAHGGRIWAEGNSQGGGGRFHFTLLDATPESDIPIIDRAQHDYVLPNQLNGTQHGA